MSLKAELSSELQEYLTTNRELSTSIARQRRDIRSAL